MPRGGPRPNSGRKPDPQLVEFRTYWRAKFDQPRWRKWLAMKAIRNERILATLLAHAYGQPPQSVKLEVAAPKAERRVELAGGDPRTPTATAVPGPGTLQ